MPIPCFLFAQATDPTLIGSGWAGWSSFGLTGLFLSWLLFKHLPRLMDEHKEAMANLQKSYTTSLDAILKHCKEEMEKIEEVVRAELRGRSRARDRPPGGATT